MLETLLNYSIISFIFAAIWAPILIWILYRFNIVIRHRLMGNKMNAEFIKIHGHKSGTPRTGGLIISIPLYVLGLILLPPSDIKMVFLIGVTFFTVYGLADDLLVSSRKLSDKFRLLQERFEWRVGKLALLYGIGLMMTYLLVQVAGIEQVTLWTQVDMFSNIFGNDWSSVMFDITSWPAMIIMAFLMITAMYGVEIMDGADGLVTGQFLILYVAFAVIGGLTGAAFVDPVVGILIGASLVYLYFNINPARVFMGGTGTFPVAFTLIVFALLTNTVFIFLVMGIMFWVELASSFIQIMSIRFFKRKVFKIAPIHHHFEAIGWPEAKVVQRFWLVGIVAAIFGLWLYTRLFA